MKPLMRYLVEISIFSLNDVTVRLKKIMNNLLEISQNTNFSLDLNHEYIEIDNEHIKTTIWWNLLFNSIAFLGFGILVFAIGGKATIMGLFKFFSPFLMGEITVNVPQYYGIGIKAEQTNQKMIQEAGMVVVADGTAKAEKRVERVLTTDPGTGVMRHVDAGYEKARVPS